LPKRTGSIRFLARCRGIRYVAKDLWKNSGPELHDFEPPQALVISWRESLAASGCRS